MKACRNCGSPCPDDGPEPLHWGAPKLLIGVLVMAIRPEVLCPWCRAVNDDATDVERSKAVPEAGDITVCLYCGGLGVFIDGTHGKRRPTPAELYELSADPRVQWAVLATRQLAEMP